MHAVLGTDGADGQAPMNGSAVAGGGNGRDPHASDTRPERRGRSHGLPIRGLRGDLPVRFDPDCLAIPGDRIVGILTRGEGITIYPIYASALREFDDEPDRWLDVAWDIDPDAPERFTASIQVTCLNEVGALAGITQVIGQHDANIENLSMIRRSADFYDMDIDLGVWDLTHLNRIISGIRQLSVVHKVARQAA